jgi:hypothetical protein
MKYSKFYALWEIKSESIRIGAFIVQDGLECDVGKLAPQKRKKKKTPAACAQELVQFPWSPRSPDRSWFY